MNSTAIVKCVALWLFVIALAAMPTKAEEKLPTLRPASPLRGDELAQLLGASIWKFQVTVPADATGVKVGLSLKEKGSEAQDFGSGFSTYVDETVKRELLIAIIPISGSIDDAEKVRVVISGFAASTTAIVNNPFKQQSLGRFEMPLDNKDGTFTLLGGYAGSTVSLLPPEADNVLSLKIDFRKAAK